MDLIRAALWTGVISICAACTSTQYEEPAAPSNPDFVFQERCDFRAKKGLCANKTVGASCGQQARCLATEELGKLSDKQSNDTKYFSCSCDQGAPPPFAKSSCEITGQCSQFGDVYSIKFDTESCPMDYNCPVPGKRDPVWESLSCQPSEDGPVVRFRRPCIRGKLSKKNPRKNRFLQGLKGPARRSDQVPILW